MPLAVLNRIRRGIAFAVALTGLLWSSAPALAQNEPTVLVPQSTEQPRGSQGQTPGAGGAPADEPGSLLDPSYTPRPEMPYPPPRKPSPAERRTAAEAADDADDGAADDAPAPDTLALRPAVAAAGADGLLRLDRTADRRTFAFRIPDVDGVRAVRFQTRYRNAADVLSEASYFRVALNGEEIARLRSAAVTGFARIEVEVEPQLLRDGRNTLTLEASHVHRVDCSIDGTFDLWTEVDTRETELRLRYADAVPGVRAATFDAWLRSSAFAGAPVRVLQPRATARDDAAAWAGYAAQGLGARTPGYPLEFRTVAVDRPDDSFRPGEGLFAGIDADNLAPGLYVLAGETDVIAPLIGTTLAGQIDGPHRSVHRLGRDARRAILVLSGRSPAEVTRAAERFAGLRGRTRFRIPDPRRAPTLRGDTQATFAELGFDPRPASGLVYEQDLVFRMPAALFVRRQQEARLELDYSYAGRLGADARLVLSLNGEVVATRPLESETGAEVSDQAFRIPLSKFRPGRNALTVSAELPPQDGAPCPGRADGSADAPPRFRLSDTSTIAFDDISLLYALPSLHLTASTGYPYDRASAPVPLVTTSRADAENAGMLTLISQIRRAGDRGFRLVGGDDTPGDDAGDALIVGNLESLPDSVLAGAPFTRARLAELMRSTDGNGGSLARGRDVDEPFWRRWIPAWLREPGVQTYGPRRIFEAFSVVMQYEAPGGDGRTYTVVTAEPGADFAHVGALLATPGVWGRLGGTATAIDRDGVNMAVYPPEQRYYVAEQQVGVGSAMLIAGDWLSERVFLLTAFVLVLCLLFGYVLFNLLEATGRGHDGQA